MAQEDLLLALRALTRGLTGPDRLALARLTTRLEHLFTATLLLTKDYTEEIERLQAEKERPSTGG